MRPVNQPKVTIEPRAVQLTGHTTMRLDAALQARFGNDRVEPLTEILVEPRRVIRGSSAPPPAFD